MSQTSRSTFDPLRLTLRAQPRSGQEQIRTLPELNPAALEIEFPREKGRDNPGVLGYNRCHAESEISLYRIVRGLRRLLPCTGGGSEPDGH